MSRRIQIDKISLNIYDIEPFLNDEYKGFVIKWEAGIGFGEYAIYQNIKTGKWCCDSEGMDSKEDKEFLQELMKLIIKMVDVMD